MLLPPPGAAAGGAEAGPEKHCRRLVLDAIFTRWVRAGAWRRIRDAQRDRLRMRAGRDPAHGCEYPNDKALANQCSLDRGIWNSAARRCDIL